MTDLKNLNRYQIEEPIGSGAYAHVYRAFDPALKRTVALKVLKPALLADEEAFARFVQEAQVTAGLFHPHIATVLDLGESEGYFFIAMRYVDGLALDKILRERGFLPWSETLQIAQQIASALDFAHAKGLVRRDVKPQNILVSQSEGAVLTDFGLVKAMESSGFGTRSGVILGTPQYIAPEIWKGLTASPASDQYALACVISEMLSGRVLYESDTPWAAVVKHTESPDFPVSWPEDVPSNVESILYKALSMDPGRRYHTVGQFIAGLEHPKTESLIGHSINLSQPNFEEEQTIPVDQQTGERHSQTLQVRSIPPDIDKKSPNLTQFQGELKHVTNRHNGIIEIGVYKIEEDEKQTIDEKVSLENEYPKKDETITSMRTVEGERTQLAENNKRRPVHAPTQQVHLPIWTLVIGILLLAVVVLLGGSVISSRIMNNNFSYLTQTADAEAKVLFDNITPSIFTKQTKILTQTFTPIPVITLTPYYTLTNNNPSSTPILKWYSFNDFNFVNDLYYDGTTLWVATSGGLVQWDINTKKMLSTWTVNNGLPSNDIYSIFIDHTGQVWIGSGSIGLAKLQNGKWITVADKILLGSNFVTDITEDQTGNLWVATDGGGVSRYNGVNWDRFTPENSKVDDSVYVIFVDLDGSLWFGSGQKIRYPSGHGLAHFDGQTWESFSLSSSEKDIWNIIRAPNDGGLWAAGPWDLWRYIDGKWESISEEGGSPLIIVGNEIWSTSWNGNKSTITRYDPRTAKQLVETETVSQGLSTMVLLENGLIWGGAGIDGLVQRLSSNNWQSYRLDAPDGGRRLSSLAESPNGLLGANKWTGTIYHYINGTWEFYGNPGLSRIADLLTSKDGTLLAVGEGGVASNRNGQWHLDYQTNYFTKVIEDSTGTLWFETSGKVIRLTNGKWTEYVIKQVDYWYENRISNGPAGDVWILNSDGAIRIPSGAEKSDWQIFNKDNGLSSNNVLTALEDSTGRYWVLGESVNMRDLTGQWHDYSIEARVKFVNQAIEDKQGAIWLAGMGLVKYFNNYWETKLSITTDIRQLLLSHDESIWVATYGDGVYRFLPDGSKEHYNSQAGNIASDYVKYIFEDSTNTIWFDTLGGLSRLSP